jgi:hypothetical protein
MPSGLENLDNNRFILRYEHPWGGVASDAAPEDIAPNQFVICDGLLIKNGKLCSTNIYPFDPAYFNYTGTAGNKYWTGADGIQIIYTVGVYVVCIDRSCRTWYYDFNQKIWIADFVPVAIDGTTPKDHNGNMIFPHYSCSIMIKGIIYIFDYVNATEYVYIPRTSNTQGQIGGAGNSFNETQNIVGGKYCMTVDHYLIIANTNLIIDNPAIKENRYNWSAPEAYTTFGPVSGSGVVDPTNPNTPLGLETGYNTLPEVQQAITGCFAMGNVGYILHDQGITQLTPTGIAKGPFDATLLWGGKEGIGCTMPETLAVFGYIAVWGNGSNFFLYSSGAAPQEICGAAKGSIYDDINKFKNTDSRILNISGQICNMAVDNLRPELIYNLYIVYESPANTAPVMTIVWTYVFRTQTWTRNVVNVQTLMQQITGNSNYSAILNTTPGFPAPASTFKFPSDTTVSKDIYSGSVYGGIIINVTNNANGIADSFFLLQYINSEGNNSLTDLAPTTNLFFKTEEFGIFRKPTIRGVIVRASGIGTLGVAINGYKFSDIIVNSSLKSALYRSFGMYTDMAPTISITTTNFNGFITKVHAFGTYAEGEPI